MRPDASVLAREDVDAVILRRDEIDLFGSSTSVRAPSRMTMRAGYARTGAGAGAGVVCGSRRVHEIGLRPTLVIDNENPQRCHDVLPIRQCSAWRSRATGVRLERAGEADLPPGPP